jgi:hypothetical protein
VGFRRHPHDTCIERPIREGMLMQGETKERWKVLCEQAATEQDPAKLMELVKEIDELLAKKQDRLNNLPHDPETTP